MRKLAGAILVAVAAVAARADDLPGFPFVFATGHAQTEVAPDLARVSFTVKVFHQTSSNAVALLAYCSPARTRVRKRKGRRQSGEMKAKRTFITDQFLAAVRTSGSLALAMERMKAHESSVYEPLPKMRNWMLVCEEIVDTEHSPEHYERCVAELRRRGFSDITINEMRDFAWQTAGWFNFEKMVWDWCALDEDDIRKALEWQEKDGEITPDERRQMEEYLDKYADRKAGQSPPPHGPADHSDGEG